MPRPTVVHGPCTAGRGGARPGVTAPGTPAARSTRPRRRGVQPGSRPLSPTARSSSGASSGTGTTGPKGAARRMRRRPRRPGIRGPRTARPGRGRTPGRWPGPGPSRGSPVRRRRRRRRPRRAGRTPPARVMPVQAAGSRQASASSSSAFGSSSRQPGPMSGAAASGGVSVVAPRSLRAASRKATDRPMQVAEHVAHREPGTGRRSPQLLLAHALREARDDQGLRSEVEGAYRSSAALPHGALLVLGSGSGSGGVDRPTPELIAAGT